MARLVNLAVAVVAALASALLPTALAWGAMGHEAIAYVASAFVSGETEAYFQGLLGDASADYLASVASWADSYRYTDEGAFSAAFHYVDANDDPPAACDVDYERDCPKDGGCIVSALTNYTTILLDGRYSEANRVIAAKMVIHFAGDVGQPLHCEALEVGGNGIDVTYDGEDTNLHAVWDSDIPESVSGGSSLSSAKSWAATLTTAINSGEYKSEAAGWVDGLSVDTEADRTATALQWASESNAYVCSTVLVDGVSAVQDAELSGDYTDLAQPVVMLQVAKQGYRLAKWLDAVVAAA